MAEKKQAGRRRRKDPRRELTRGSLIEAAESLFSERGIDAVSMREIGAAIGAANTNVVGYHFGGKEALVEAVIHHRLPAFEQRREQLLRAARQRPGGPSLEELLIALWMPLLEQTDARGRHSYAGFLGALSRSGLGWLRVAMSEEYPVTGELAEEIRAALPESLRPLFFERMRINAAMVNSVLRIIDLEQDITDERREFLFTDTIRMSCAALLAPVD